MKVNGKEVQFPEGTTVSQILDNYKIDRNRVVVEIDMKIVDESESVSYTHLTLPTNCSSCRSRWSPYH